MVSLEPGVGDETKNGCVREGVLVQGLEAVDEPNIEVSTLSRERIVAIILQ